MHANTGFRAEAFSQAKRFVRLYQDAEAVVIPSSSCVAMIRDQYPGLFEELGNEELRTAVRSLLPRVYELSEFLIDRAGRGGCGSLLSAPRYVPRELPWTARAAPGRSARFACCSKVRGLELVPLANLDRCCGFGGTFSIKNAEVSSAMLSAKLHDVLATRAEYCTALDNSCLMHLGGALHRQFAAMKTIHMARDPGQHRSIAGGGDA